MCQPSVVPLPQPKIESAPAVSIIIVSWNTAKITIECIESIIEHCVDSSYEIILVDNASADDTASQIRSRFPQVVVIENTENKGFAGANNDGIRIARGEYILLLNSDTVVHNNILVGSIKFLETNPDIGVFGAQAFDGNGRYQSTMFAYLSVCRLFWNLILPGRILSQSQLFGKGRYVSNDPNLMHDVDVVAGCYMFIRRKVIDQTQGFDDEFFMFGEEMEWCYRISQQGWRIVYYPGVSYTHYGGVSSEKCMSEMNVEMARGQLLFLLRTRNSLVARLAAALMALRDLPRLFLFVPIFFFPNLTKSSFSNAAKMSVVRLPFLIRTAFARDVKNTLLRSRTRKPAYAASGVFGSGKAAECDQATWSTPLPYSAAVGTGPYGKNGLVIRLVYLFVAILSYLSASVFFRRARRHWVVLCYHAVEGHHAKNFRSQLEWVSESVVDVDQIGTGKTGVCLTFDDAFACLLDWAIPPATRYNCPIAIFPVTGNCNSTPSWAIEYSHPDRALRTMSFEELRTINQNPLVTIGSHTVTHPFLGKLDQPSVERELMDSGRTIQELTGFFPKDLALPHGSKSELVVETAKKCGYGRVYSLEEFVNTQEPGDFLGRFLVSPEMWPIEFKLTCLGAYGFLHRFRQLLNAIRRCNVFSKNNMQVSSINNDASC